MNLKAGTRVTLKEFWNGEELVPVQRGTLLDDIRPGCSTVVVEIDTQFRDVYPTLDDGIREVPIDQIEVIR